MHSGRERAWKKGWYSLFPFSFCESDLSVFIFMYCYTRNIESNIESEKFLFSCKFAHIWVPNSEWGADGPLSADQGGGWCWYNLSCTFKWQGTQFRKWTWKSNMLLWWWVRRSIVKEAISVESESDFSKCSRLLFSCRTSKCASRWLKPAMAF